MPYLDMQDHEHFVHLVQPFLAAHPEDRAVNEGTNRDIISFTPVRILADCVEASKSWNINIPLYTASEPMKRLSRRVTCSNGIHQTQSPSLRIYVKEFMTGFAGWASGKA
jgi:hypothetical protein